MDKPPEAPVRPHTFRLHGEERVDNYHWLRDPDDPAVPDYLAAENAYTQKFMLETSALQETLFQEMKARFKVTDVSVAQRLDDYLYYYRAARDKQYLIHCRRHGSEQAPEQVILDVNELAEGHDEYFSLGAFRVSPDHSLLAYSVDSAGDEVFTIFIKDLATGELIPDRLERTFGQVEWAADNKTLLYVGLDESMRPHEVKLHLLGTQDDADLVIYREHDDAFHLSAGKSKTKNYLFISADSASTSEVRFVDASNPYAEWQLVEPRRHDVEYSVDHQEERFIVLSDEGTTTFRLYETPVGRPSREHWTPIATDDDFLIEEFEVYRNHLVVLGRKDGLQQVLVLTRAGDSHYLDFPEPTYAVDVVGNPEYDASSCHLRYSSLVTPHSIFDYDLDVRSLRLLKQLEVASGYDPSRYRTERLLCAAPHGVHVPISLVYRIDAMHRDGRNPLLLTGYGAYGESSDPEFVLERLSLLDRGFAFAIAHVRGGGEFGESWHDDGRLLTKKNTFTDFIACAEHLIAERYTSSEVLVIHGRSAGGLLVGAVANMRGELPKIAVADVPFVDLINSMLDPALPLTPIELEEWGDPRDPAAYEYMKGYSPYDCVKAQRYPHMLVNVSLKDARVPYWEPFKWVARLRALKTDPNTLLLRVLPAGHPGVSGRLDYIREEAFEQAFLLRFLGVA